MINTDPLNRLLAERGLDTVQLSQLTGIPLYNIQLIMKGRSITPETLNTLCQILNCQPSDIIEFTKTESKGHWEWVSNDGQMSIK